MSTQILLLHFQKINYQAPDGKHSATFPSEQAGEGTGSMPHIAASPLGKESQSISAQEIIILISNLPPFPLPILPP